MPPLAAPLNVTRITNHVARNPPPICYTGILPFPRGATMSVRVPVAFAVLAAVLIPGIAPGQQPPAGLDAEAAVPYQWRIVIQARPHPLLTPPFRDQLRRDLLAALQPGLGALGTVEVIDLDALPRDKWDALWQQFDDKGFAALDAPRDLTGVKTHFLRVEYKDGSFHLEARQHDGFTGLASPVVRKQAVRAAELVGRAAGLMVERDFGLAGTVELVAGKTDEATIRFKGGTLGPLERFVKVGDVFAVARITRLARPALEPTRTATGKIIAPAPGSQAPAALQPAYRDFTLLRVTELKDGTAKCAVLTRYAAAMPLGGTIAGYRCLHLPTVAAPVSVRLVGGDGTTPPSIPVANVRANDVGFTDRPNPKDFLDFRDGAYRSNRPLGNVACVTVSLGETRSERFPVPVFGPEPVVLRFEVDPKAEDKANFERAVTAVTVRTSDARTAQVACFDGVAKLLQAKKNAEALARAKGGFQAADNADKVLAEELDQLKKDLKKSPGAEPLLGAVDRQLAALKASNQQLAARITDLEQVVGRENDPSSVARDVQAQNLNSQINFLLSSGDVDQALVAYDQLATLVPDATPIKARREKLAAEWKPKDDAHAKARQYLLKTWPALATPQDLKESLAALRTAVNTCKEAKDKYAFRKLGSILSAFPVKLTDLIKDLDPNADADRKALDDVKAVRDVVSKLEAEIIEFQKANP